MVEIREHYKINYRVGQEVWLIYENKIDKAIIESVTISRWEDEEKEHIGYVLKNEKTGGIYRKQSEVGETCRQLLEQLVDEYKHRTGNRPEVYFCDPWTD